ncbi:MAG TPA: hypothetical protein VGV59_09425 [Pyrinomonadaceae bacterium]|nr:hypothetical protein [Pyrinomonadaceae bacterium]
MNTIPQTVNELAAQILASQSNVPMSPAERDESGNINLCLAAAVAKAGLELHISEARAREFAEELEKTRSKEIIERAFVQLGWSVDACRTRIALNDRTHRAVRKRRLISYLLEH